MRLRLAICLLGSLFLASCGKKFGPADPQAYVGTYIYHSEVDSGESRDRSDVKELTLKKDGSYILVLGVAPASTQISGVWRLLVSGGPPTVLLDSAGYPALVVNRQIRLLVNDDLDEWYTKVN